MKLHRAENVLKLFATGKIEKVNYEYEYRDCSCHLRQWFRNIYTFTQINGPVSLTETRRRGESRL
jgi:hypothetical protein